MTAYDQRKKAVEEALAADREATLRDVFAAAALSALVGRYDREDSIVAIARAAYLYADNMLAVRKC